MALIKSKLEFESNQLPAEEVELNQEQMKLSFEEAQGYMVLATMLGETTLEMIPFEWRKKTYYRCKQGEPQRIVAAIAANAVSKK